MNQSYWDMIGRIQYFNQIEICKSILWCKIKKVNSLSNSNKISFSILKFSNIHPSCLSSAWQQTLLTEDLKQKTRKNIEEIILCHPPAVPDTFMVDAAKYLRCGKNNFCQEMRKFAHAHPFIFPHSVSRLNSLYANVMSNAGLDGVASWVQHKVTIANKYTTNCSIKSKLYKPYKLWFLPSWTQCTSHWSRIRRNNAATNFSGEEEDFLL